MCLRKSVCVLYLCADRRGVGGTRGELLVNIVFLREYVCVFKEISVCVVFVC